MFDRISLNALAQPVLMPIDRMAAEFLRPPAGMEVDFSNPPGEAALVGPDSLSWIVFKNPITVFTGGVAGVLLELAEPRVRDGVWQHTSFRSAPLDRLKRTGLAAMVTVYGPRSVSEKMISRVVRMHGHVRGVTSEGEAYHANDPDLLVWVQATASFGFMEAYHRYVRPLSPRERDQLLGEGRVAAGLYGAAGAPVTQAAMGTLFDAHRRTLVASPIVHEFLRIMERVPAFPAAGRPLQHLLIKAAVEILPSWVRERLDLTSGNVLSLPEMAVVRAAAAAAERVMLQSYPAAQACRRLGLPDDYLYRSRGPVRGASLRPW